MSEEKEKTPTPIDDPCDDVTSSDLSKWYKKPVDK